MGIDWNTARFLVAARSSGVAFDRTATIGRHHIFYGAYGHRRVLSRIQRTAVCRRVGYV